ncbi:putative mannitol dehydrogenase [Chlorella sorokiniana]|uniref:Mannitol dehydrogenase n=1 Tax=Chlorella sorokiniana TaxID=3076 RepID=A0A2P6TNC1_CHLSO|nr:putative mannitol dehydrogenase [Chlorella sorokiniana]|eukprot:PRW50837.1 putative mannitol dehydrogenase [Chlorella sorokiniana]
MAPPTAAAVKACPENGESAAPKEALQQVVRQYGSNGHQELPGELGFDKLAQSLHRGCTHPDAKALDGQGQGSGNCLGFAAHDESGTLSAVRFERRALSPQDIRIQIAYVGICHSDLHKIRNEWGESTRYPCIPGGWPVRIGSSVGNFKVGDRAAVGCMVGSCGRCEDCSKGLEQYCNPTGPIWQVGMIVGAGETLARTYDSEDSAEGGAITRGGYSTHIVVQESFALHLPANLPMDAAAPLLCAGITTYSPLRHFGLDKPGKKVGVVGLGGLGHMAVKLAKAFGCEVTVISTSPNKKEEACACLGADHFVVRAREMKAAVGSLDGIIDTVSAKHDLASYLSLLKTDGALVMVGLSPDPLEVLAFSLTSRRRTLAGSGIGGIKETQEMLDFCGQHNVTCDIELINIDYVNQAMDRLEKNDVRYRFVIDIQGSLVA